MPLADVECLRRRRRRDYFLFSLREAGVVTIHSRNLFAASSKHCPMAVDECMKYFLQVRPYTSV